jgi:predicted RNA binding protein YcfA (HicA-like mRNA interferase family)
MNFLELERIIKADGWKLDRTSGSHYIYFHALKPGAVVMAYHKGDIKPKTVNSILKQAGLKKKEKA